MANVKNKRKRILEMILFIIIIALFLYLKYYLESNNLENESTTNEQHDLHLIQQEDESGELGELFLTMIDVGQADSFLLEQNGKTALVDCGTRSTGKDVVEYLKNAGITKLDYVFGTHPHDDHMGGMFDVITNFEIGEIVIPKVTKINITSSWYAKLMNEIMNGDYSVVYPQVGDIYYLGNATIKVLGPIEEPTSNINNYSTVMMVSFGQMDILMTGDAETEVEKAVLESGANLDAEILKVGHHGSDTSSSEEFLDAISPNYALISTEVGNKYNHPVKSTMEKLKARNVEVYRTDECGTVVARITSNNASFSTNPGDYISGPELVERTEK